MPLKEASSRIKINKLLEDSGWRFFDDEQGKANIVPENHTKISRQQIDALGEDFEHLSSGFVDYLLLDDKGFPLIVLEAKGNLHYLLDLNRGTPKTIITFPLPDHPTQRRIAEQIEREQALVRASRELVGVFEGKIKERVNRVWGEG
jgi:type I restriction enzyme, R subunit